MFGLRGEKLKVTGLTGDTGLTGEKLVGLFGLGLFGLGLFGLKGLTGETLTVKGEKLVGLFGLGLFGLGLFGLGLFGLKGLRGLKGLTGLKGLPPEIVNKLVFGEKLPKKLV